MSELNIPVENVVSKSPIKSIQRLSLYGSGTKTIVAVDMEKTTINILSTPLIGGAGGTIELGFGDMGYVYLSDSTTLTHKCRTGRHGYRSAGGVIDGTYMVEVVEYI